MKNIAVVILAFFVLSVPALAQESSDMPPAAVVAAFEQKFPIAKKPKWEPEDDVNWEVEFKQDGRKYSADYTANGDWLETEYAIKSKDLPERVRKILDSNLTDYKIKEVEVADTPDGTFYEIEVSADGETFEVEIDANDNFMKKVEIKEVENTEEGAIE
jgi:hypothetical protein